MIEAMALAGGVLFWMGLCSIVIGAVWSMFDLWGDGPVWVLRGGAMVLIAFGVSIPHLIREHDKERGAFMAECLSERARYECVALWKGQQTAPAMHAPVVVIPRVGR